MRSNITVQHGPPWDNYGQLMTTPPTLETGVTLHQLLWLQIFLCVYNILCLTGLMPMPDSLRSRKFSWVMSYHAQKMERTCQETPQNRQGYRPMAGFFTSSDGCTWVSSVIFHAPGVIMQHLWVGLVDLLDKAP